MAQDNNPCRRTKQQQGSDAREWGHIAEDIAANYLVSKGYTIEARNWSPPHGHKEIDIISCKGKRIIFVEVKARDGIYNDPLDAMTKEKMRNLFACAESYLKSKPEDYWEYQFDIITIEGDINKYELKHYPDAFLGPLRTYR